MKLSELKRVLDLPRHERDDEEVRIILAKPSIGGIATCGVSGVNFGYDWDRGKFLLRPEVDLAPKTDKERIWDAAMDLLLYLATKPVKRPSYEIDTARKIFDQIGYDYMQCQRFVHPETRDKARGKGPE